MREREAEPLLTALPEEQRFATWHLIRPNGEIVSGGTGEIVLMEELPLRQVARLLVALRLEPVVHGTYGLVSRNRGRLGKLVPNRPGPRRYP